MNDLIKKILAACDSTTGEPTKLRQTRKELITHIPAALKSGISAEMMTVLSASIPALSGGSSQPDQQKAMKLAIKQLAAGIRAVLKNEPVIFDANAAPAAIPAAPEVSLPPPPAAASLPPAPALSAWDTACGLIEEFLPRSQCASPSRAMLRAQVETELRNQFAVNVASRIVTAAADRTATSEAT